jgi:hypothetical protein
LACLLSSLLGSCLHFLATLPTRFAFRMSDTQMNILNIYDIRMAILFLFHRLRTNHGFPHAFSASECIREDFSWQEISAVTIIHDVASIPGRLVDPAKAAQKRGCRNTTGGRSRGASPLAGSQEARKGSRAKAAKRVMIAYSVSLLSFFLLACVTSH